MAAPEPTIDVLVEAALPQSALFGEENFAGDPVVQEFFHWIRKQLAIDPRIFVSWSCPPEVFVLESSTANVLVRSERFDTLLVEYLHLKEFAKREANQKTRREVYSTSILRWMFEFFLGHGEPTYALYAITKAHENYSKRLQTIPFRDQSLASLPDVQRAAVQCFCLAHEMAHLVQDNNAKPSLLESVDGVRVVDHLNRELDAADLRQNSRDQMLKHFMERVDAANLLHEINADSIAMEFVSVYLSAHFQVSLEDTINAALCAFEAQCFLYSGKHSCALFGKYGGRAGEDRAFALDDWLGSTQLAVRARCVLRHSGIIWAKWSDPEEELTVQKINRYVPRVDAMFAEHQGFLAEVAEAFADQSKSLRRKLPPAKSVEDKALFAALLDKVRSSEEIRMDIYYAMIAMGFGGATNVVRYLEAAGETRYVGL